MAICALGSPGGRNVEAAPRAPRCPGAAESRGWVEQRVGRLTSKATRPEGEALGAEHGPAGMDAGCPREGHPGQRDAGPAGNWRGDPGTQEQRELSLSVGGLWDRQPWSRTGRCGSRRGGLLGHRAESWGPSGGPGTHALPCMGLGEGLAAGQAGEEGPRAREAETRLREGGIWARGRPRGGRLSQGPRGAVEGRRGPGGGRGEAGVHAP